MNLPKEIFSGYWPGGHVQGIAVDPVGGYIYYSFTNLLLKTDLCGNPVGSVVNLAGHLGCLTFDPERNRVYGSLEMKHDAIGRGIISRTGWDPNPEDNFYLVSFDCEKIDRMEIDADGNDIMLAVWLADVARDYKGTDPVSGKEHIYGCSGIDGTGFGPVFGADPDSPKKIMTAYGVYSDLDRRDNDHQVFLQNDPSVFSQFGKPLNQASPHHSGPESCEARYFLYTGNTEWGVQNLEYDAHSRTWLVAVYPGKKKAFTNFRMFFIDAAAEPRKETLAGRNGETGLLLTLAALGETGKHGLRGTRFLYGSTGVCSMGNGLFYFSKLGKDVNNKGCCNVLLYRFDPGTKNCFTREQQTGAVTELPIRIKRYIAAIFAKR